MINIKDLTFAYGGQPPIYKNFHWRTARGEAWSVIGPSGCGKTTRDDLENAVIRLRSEMNLSYIMVTHDIEVALVMGSQILVLGAAPNQNPRILENEFAGVVDHRNSTGFQNKCAELRKLLGELT